jgi:hypothetical protein
VVEAPGLTVLVDTCVGNDKDLGQPPSASALAFLRRPAGCRSPRTSENGLYVT